MTDIVIDDYGRAYCTKRDTAYTFRVEDHSADRIMQQKGFNFTKYINLYHYDKTSKIYWLPPTVGKTGEFRLPVKLGELPITLYPEQAQAVASTLTHIKSGSRISTITSDTGTGKSRIIGGLIQALPFATLIVVPSIAIGIGIEEKLKPLGCVEFLQSKIIMQRYTRKQLPDILIVTRQSLQNVYPFINGEYATMIIDEFHHVLSDKNREFVNLWKGACIIGLTATLYRKEADTTTLQKFSGSNTATGLESLPVKVFVHTYEYTYLQQDLMDAAEKVKDPTSPEYLRTLVNSNPGFIEEINKVLKKIRYELGFRRIIIVCDRVDFFEKLYKRYPKAIPISGKHPVKDALEALEGKKEYLILAMSQCVGEGFDVPALEIGIQTFSTSRELVLEQIIGRTRRKAPGKEFGFRVDIHLAHRIAGKLKHFGYPKRAKFYKSKGREIYPLDEYKHG